MIFVLAGDFRQYTHFCAKELELSNDSAAKFGVRYLRDAQMFRGQPRWHDSIEIVKVGTWR